MIVDTEVLRDEDVSALATHYAALVTDQDITPRLRAWSWCLSFALVEEGERRRDTAAMLPPDPLPGSG